MKYPAPYALPDETGIRELLALARRCAINCLDSAPASGSSAYRRGALSRPQARLTASENGGKCRSGKSHFTFPVRHTQETRLSPAPPRGARYRRDSLQRQRRFPLLRDRSPRNSRRDQGKRLFPCHRPCALRTDTRAAIARVDVPMLIRNRDDTRNTPAIRAVQEAGFGIRGKKSGGSVHPLTTGESNGFRFPEPVTAVVTGATDRQPLSDHCQTITATAHAYPL